MTHPNQRIKILQILHEKRATDSRQALDCEDLARLIGVSWEAIQPEVTYLEKQGYVVLRRIQLQTARIFCKLNITSSGIDLLDGKIVDTSVKLAEGLLHNQDRRSPVRFKLQLSLRNEMEFEVRALETPMGEPHTLSRLPYTAVELNTILKALRRPKPGQLKKVGLALYEALMFGDVHTAFQMALNQARQNGSAVALQLRFDDNAIELARYPWELLYYRRALLPSRTVELTRYISYSEAVTSLPVISPLRLLYIQSRPTNLSVLPDESERTGIYQALHKLEQQDDLKVDLLPQPTYESLLDYLETHLIHILHFDGHGGFGRRCPKCEGINYSHLTHCAVCAQEIEDIEPQGYLAFEDNARQVYWLSSETLSHLLYNRLHLVVLSACWSSRVDGDTLFSGTAPALIQAGVPAVVSTQLPIGVETAVKFMQGFYRALARFESIPAATNAGRLRIIDSNEWFIPTLYLRSQGDESNLFKQH